MPDQNFPVKGAGSTEEVYRRMWGGWNEGSILKGSARAAITASMEKLYHYRCTADSCKKWWSVADIEPTIGDAVFCPHCGTSYELVEIVTPPIAVPEQADDREQLSLDVL